jgi:hypothetical protein
MVRAVIERTRQDRIGGVGASLARDELPNRYDAMQEFDLDGVVIRVAFTRIQ